MRQPRVVQRLVGVGDVEVGLGDRDGLSVGVPVLDREGALRLVEAAQVVDLLGDVD